MTAVSVGLLDSMEAMEAAPDAPIPFVPVGRLSPLDDEPSDQHGIADALADIDGIESTADAYAHAMAYEQQLEDERPLVKEEAIIRIMQVRKIASTPAEKIVETDAEYMAHRLKQRTAIVDCIRKQGAFEAAKRRADLGVALVHTTSPSRG